MSIRIRWGISGIAAIVRLRVERLRIGKIGLILGLIGLAFANPAVADRHVKNAPDKSAPIAHGGGSAAFICKHTVTAKVVALEQVYYYNRTGSFNPAGLMYALRRDVVPADDASAGLEIDRVLDRNPGTAAVLEKYAGHVTLRPDKRPRPLVLRVNEGDCLKVIFTNLLSRSENGEEIFRDPANGRDVPIESEEPATRHASMHVNGLELVGRIESDGSNVGVNPSSLAAPGETRVYTWYAKKEGGYLLYSMAGPAGGEGDGGQLGLGLFGSVNVEPKGSRWYRSQVTASQLASAEAAKHNPNGTPVIRYDAVDQHGQPVLAILNHQNEIVHTDLNAVIDATGEECSHVTGPSSSCGLPFREFTAIFHDEVTAEQAFPELEDEDNPIAKLKDGMAINYGAAGMGAMVLSNRKGVGPSAECAECKLEEFFLSSWAMGDPAMVVGKDESNKAVEAFYPDDPSNVHHSYMGDPVRFRNLHAGPKETHVFHLHDHQWVQDWHDPNSVYLDSQTISPGASYTYEIQYGGSGNRNFGPGDSIFHCHLYPHFAQGMWALWRSHDVFEAGTPDRNLPDAEIAAGTPNPAVVPLPHAALPPMPTEDFKGYPFYIAGKAGHRPPQPPYDMEKDPVTGAISDGGLPRHRIEYATRVTEEPPVNTPYLDPNLPASDPQAVSSKIAVRVRSENGDPALFSFAAQLTSAKIKLLPYEGTPKEKRAMRFHAGLDPGAVDVVSRYKWHGKGYPSCDAEGRCDKPDARVLFNVNGRHPISGAPYSDPCPDTYEAPYGTTHAVQTRNYRAAYVQFDMPVNKFGWHDPQARIITLEQDIADTINNVRPAEPFFFRANSGECVVFHGTNLMPSNLNLDDFQVFSPTDTIGQHIHLVKFDVTSSDGSANGWNYEDATFSAEEVRERIEANNAYQKLIGGSQFLKPQTHRLFGPDGALAGNPRGLCPEDPEHWNDHPWCGAQTSLQRWWANPLLNSTTPLGKKEPAGQDRTIRTVFTHDHLGPSSHQQHGLYAALVIEPPMSVWETLGGVVFGGTYPNGHQIVGKDRKDGGPTSYAASILTPKSASHEAKETREFNLAFADFALMYDLQNRPVNPPNRLDHDLPNVSIHSVIPRPEGISSADPGGQMINYRNEPIPLRIAKWDESKRQWVQKTESDSYARCMDLVEESEACDDAGCFKRACNPGDLANVFSSMTHVGLTAEPADDPRRKLQFSSTAEPLDARQDGDPSTPLLTAYEGDHVQVRLIQGAQEENHIFTMHGAKWLSQAESKNSGYMNGQQIGISEHFEFDVQFFTPSKQADQVDYLYSSSATDNFWDGQWGILRAFGARELQNLKRLPGNPRSRQPEQSQDRLINPSQSACPDVGTPGFKRRNYEISAVLARDLFKKLKLAALEYNNRFGIHDPNAILFVVTSENDKDTHLRERLANGEKSPEPLILRARAGECVFVTLRNELPSQTRDGLEFPATWSYNMLPPLLESFNFNAVTTSSRVGLHPQLVTVNSLFGDGAHVGLNPDTTLEAAEPDSAITYHWYAGDLNYDANSPSMPHWIPIEFGVVGLQDKADVIKHASHGAIGALVVEPDDATWETDCTILNPIVPSNRQYRDCLDAAATVSYTALVRNTKGEPVKDKNGKPKREPQKFREFVVIYQDDLSLRRNGEAMPNLRNGDDAEDSGHKAFNYRTEPLWGRLGANPAADPNTMSEYDYSDVFRSVPTCANGATALPCADGLTPKAKDPETPLFTAEVGMPVRFRVVEPAGHPRNHGFTVFGHDWILNPWSQDSSVMDAKNPESANRFGSASGIGAARHVNILIDHAGGNVSQAGSTGIPGDYMYRTQEGFMFGGGLWGIFRVLPRCDGRVYKDEVRPGKKWLYSKPMVCK